MLDGLPNSWFLQRAQANPFWQLYDGFGQAKPDEVGNTDPLLTPQYLPGQQGVRFGYVECGPIDDLGNGENAIPQLNN